MSLNEGSDTWSCRTVGGIPYKLMDGYPTGDIDDEGSFNTTEAYILNASDLDAFIRESFPTTQYPTSRTMPGQPYNYTKSISFEPFPEGLPGNPFGGYNGSEGTFAQYVKVTITYTQTEDQEGDGATSFVEIAADANVEVLVTSSAFMKWESGVSITDLDLPVGHLCPQTQWTARWPKVNQAHINGIFTNLRKYMGCINVTPLSKLYNADPGTILFSGISFQQAFTYGGGFSGGSIEAKLLEKRLVTYKGGYKVYGHNHFYNKVTDLYEKIVKKDGTFIYPELDLNLLF